MDSEQSNNLGIIRELGDLPAEAVISEQALAKLFDMGGDFLGMLTDSEGAPVQLTTPTGITIDAKRRRLYVVELKADRVCWMDLE